MTKRFLAVSAIVFTLAGVFLGGQIGVVGFPEYYAAHPEETLLRALGLFLLAILMILLGLWLELRDLRKDLRAATDWLPKAPVGISPISGRTDDLPEHNFWKRPIT